MGIITSKIESSTCDRSLLNINELRNITNEVIVEKYRRRRQNNAKKTKKEHEKEIEHGVEIIKKAFDTIPNSKFINDAKNGYSRTIIMSHNGECPEYMRYAVERLPVYKDFNIGHVHHTGTHYNYDSYEIYASWTTNKII